MIETLKEISTLLPRVEYLIAGSTQEHGAQHMLEDLKLALPSLRVSMTIVDDAVYPYILSSPDRAGAQAARAILNRIGIEVRP